MLKDGIHLEKIRYWSDALAARDVGRGAEVTIKYDPRDMSRIFVRQPDAISSRPVIVTWLSPMLPGGNGSTPKTV